MCPKFDNDDNECRCKDIPYIVHFIIHFLDNVRFNKYE